MYPLTFTYRSAYMPTSRLAALFSVAAPLALVLGGCSAASQSTEPAPEDPSVEEDLASATYYQCWGGSSDATLHHFELALGAKSIRVTDLSKDAVVPDTGKLDPTYKPTSTTYKDTTRFIGFQKIADSTDEVGEVDVMIANDLLEHKPANGKLWIRMAGPEGGGTTTYDCKASTKLKPVVSTHARLACDLDQMICGNGAPPGQTCLSDVFVNQTASGSATVTLTWLDHFGVNVKERKVNAGTQTSFSRTVSTTKGAWGGNTIDLDYRAGVTYAGTIKLSDGRSAKMHCNDLGMLD
jgi:hypothetical protein